ncbi:MAG: hypothetical protein R3E02_03440 [Blastomonas sp.]
MFIGHFAPAMLAATCNTEKQAGPGLGTLFVAGQLVDYGFFAFTLIGVERMRIVPGMTAMNPMDLYHMPWTHSLAGSIGWAAGFALLVRLIWRNVKGAALAGLVVLSHWFLDLLVHRPDLTLFGSPPKLGLGLWNYPAIEIPLELALTFGALAWYLRKTQLRPGKSALPGWILAGALALFAAIDWFGPKPAEFSIDMPITALAAYSVAALLAVWLGRSREMRSPGLK